MAVAEGVKPEQMIQQLQGGLQRLIALLRGAGIPVSVSALLDAQRALGLVNPASRRDVFSALRATLIKNAAAHDVFAEAFALAWQPQPAARDDTSGPARQPKKMNQRLADAMHGEGASPASRTKQSTVKTIIHEAAGDSARSPAAASNRTYSSSESLNNSDFGDLTVSELEQVQKAIVGLRAAFRPRTRRRFTNAVRPGAVDLSRTLRGAMQTGGIPVTVRYRQYQHRTPPLVVLCDVSGSMQIYSRVLLLLAHTVARARRDVSVFLFGTRLSNVSRLIAEQDADRGLEKVAASVPDWRGGTRIGHCLREFRRDWGRRVANSTATVWLITDGLDRDAGAGLREELHRLRRHYRRLHWLNPLLRFADYQPRAAGAESIAEVADAAFAVHNLQSLLQLAHHLD